MPTKTTKSSKSYEVTGKTFIWSPLQEPGEDLPDITIPLRIKLKVIRALVGQDLDVSAMFAILSELVPGQDEVLDEMDLNDFQEMFTAWQAEYETLSGASLGKSGGSSS